MTDRSTPSLYYRTDDALIRKRTQRSLLRVDIGRGGWSHADYEALIDSARLTYCQSAKAPNVAQRVGAAILGLYGLVVLTVRAFYDFNDARWTGQ